MTDMLCAHCIYEDLGAEVDLPVLPAVTFYKGTACCKDHAYAEIDTEEAQRVFKGRE